MREVIWKHLFSLKWMLPFGSVIVSILLVIDHQSINEINKIIKLSAKFSLFKMRIARFTQKNEVESLFR